MVIRISILIDSSVIIAFHNLDDENHNRARVLMEEIVSDKFGRAYISDYIFDECVTVALIKLKSVEEAVNLGNYLIESEISMIKATENVLLQSWEIFRKRNTGRLSFTDCVNIAFLEMLEIDYLATFDIEFKKVPSIKIIGL